MALFKAMCDLVSWRVFLQLMTFSYQLVPYSLYQMLILKHMINNDLSTKLSLPI